VSSISPRDEKSDPNSYDKRDSAKNGGTKQSDWTQYALARSWAEGFPCICIAGKNRAAGSRTTLIALYRAIKGLSATRDKRGHDGGKCHPRLG
jgi:hypothetical protein